jgi:hypothetical protein
MDTDTPCVAPIAEPDSDGPGLDLFAQVHNHSRSVIKAELQRLSRRAPGWAVPTWTSSTRLEDLSESLILHRLRNAPRDTAPLLWRLFGTATEDP